LMDEAEAWWKAHFSKRESTDTMDVSIPAQELVGGRLPAWKLCWLAHDCEISRSEARRMVEGGAFEYAGERIDDANRLLEVSSGTTFRAGRHRRGERVKQPLFGRIVMPS
jgi:tyrosyl-tRNA synthetase